MGDRWIRINAIGQTYAFVCEAEEGVDLSVVTGAELKVRRNDKTTATWATSIHSQGASQLVLHHEIAPGDLTRTGPYEVYASLTMPDLVLPSEVQVLEVESEFSRRRQD